MITIARNAIYAATVITLWPSALYANARLSETSSDCPPLLAPQFAHRVVESAARDIETYPRPAIRHPSAVEYQMYAGRLKPQLERILRQHMAVQHIVWQVAEEHEWPSAYLLEGTSWSALIESLLAPYQLRLQLFANHSAVITYLPAVDALGRGGL